MIESKGKISLYYDSECRLCSGIVGSIEDSSKKDAISNISVCRELPPGVSRKEAMRDIHAVDENNTVHKGSDVVLLIISQYRGWRWLAIMGKLPGINFLIRILYRIIADNRYRLFGTVSINNM